MSCLAVFVVGCTASTAPVERRVAFQAPGRLALVALGGGAPLPFEAAGRPHPHHPDWSPDGDRLALVADEADGTSDIWLARPDGTDQRRLVDCQAPCTFAEDPAWSPDGTRIAYWTNGEGQPQVIRVADVETGEVLVTAPGAAVEPRWSPNGNRLVVSVERIDPATDEPLASAIGIIDLAADEPSIRPITPESMTAWYPDWSWNTDRIVFQAGGSSPFEMVGEPPIIYVVRPDGSDLTVLSDGAAGDPWVALPAWMPGGERILLTLIHTTDRYTLATVSTDGVVSELLDADGTPIVGAHARVPAR